MKSVIVSVATVLLLQCALTLAFSDADTDAEEFNGNSRPRRGWSMMRLGRGLQMLRLGKRTVHPPLSDNPQSTPEKMRELLGDLLEENSKDFRRQVPTSRLGRELHTDALEELYNLVGEAYLSELLPYPVVHVDRFKRSTRVSSKTNQNPWSHSEESKDDLPAASQAGQYLRHMYKFLPEKSAPMLETGHQKVGDEHFTMNDATNDEDMTSNQTSSNDQKHVTRE